MNGKFFRQENAELKELVRSLSPNKKGILLRPGEKLFRIY